LVAEVVVMINEFGCLSSWCWGERKRSGKLHERDFHWLMKVVGRRRRGKLVLVIVVEEVDVGGVVLIGSWRLWRSIVCPAFSSSFSCSHCSTEQPPTIGSSL